MYSRLAAVVITGALTGSLIAPIGVSGSAERSDHGHILVLGVVVEPGTFPPVPTAARGCIDLAAGQPVPAVAHHDRRHEGLDGGIFTSRTGNIVIPTYPYETPGGFVPWHDCDGFLAFFGLDD